MKLIMVCVSVAYICVYVCVFMREHIDICMFVCDELPLGFSIIMIYTLLHTAVQIDS